MPLKTLYHRLVPPAVREPIGRLRRDLQDAGLRLLTPGPLPPRALLRSIQMTPYVREYLDVGRRAARSIGGALAPGLGERARVLDFGCGLGRVLRHFEHRGWRLYGCDVEPASVSWSRRAFGWASFERTGETPPLPYPADFFDAVYAVSVFTHFDAGDQARWAAELARVLRPGGAAVVSTMGPRALASFREIAESERGRRFAARGFLFEPGGERFNSRGAFHTREAVARIFAPRFELASWTEGGLDGFQDLSLLRRRDCGD